MDFDRDLFFCGWTLFGGDLETEREFDLFLLCWFGLFFGEFERDSFGFFGGDLETDLEGDFFLLFIFAFWFLGGDLDTDLAGELFLLFVFTLCLCFFGGDFETDLDGERFLSAFPPSFSKTIFFLGGLFDRETETDLLSSKEGRF